WTVANTGNVRLGAEQVLDVAAPFGLDPGVEAHVVGNQYEILPGDSVTLRASVEAWPTFRLDAALTATPAVVGEDEGSGPLTAARAEVSAVAVPWPHLAALALLVLVVAGAVVSRRRRRARLERAIADARAAAHAAAA